MIKMEDLFKREFELILDKSGSMSEHDCPGNKSRWATSEEFAMAVANKAAEFGNGTVTITVFNDRSKTYENADPSRVKQIFKENEPMGGTMMGETLKARLGNWLGGSRRKSLTLVVVTDGIPTDPEAVTQAICDATKKIDSDDDIGILFLQVGKDTGARAYLKKLDDELEGNGAKFDIVSSKNSDEMAGMTLTEALLDAVNA